MALCVICIENYGEESGAAENRRVHALRRGEREIGGRQRGPREKGLNGGGGCVCE